MKILVLGADGMLGHQLVATLSEAHKVVGTIRGASPNMQALRALGLRELVEAVDVRLFERVIEVLGDISPDVIVNCVGIVKQRPEAERPIDSIEVNSLFPHRLGLAAKAVGARVVHISTDCVFSGTKGRYNESDVPDPVDLYGRSKLLGELHDLHCLTLRTSMIGLELSRSLGLVEWALAQKGKIRGFRRSVYTGLTTAELARVIEQVIALHPTISGVWGVASEPITKYDLLVQLFDKLGRNDVTVIADDGVACDRSLCGDAFADATGYRAPSWDHMISELADAVRRREEALL